MGRRAGLLVTVFPLLLELPAQGLGATHFPSNEIAQGKEPNPKGNS
jgi:hypothetical protein